MMVWVRVDRDLLHEVKEILGARTTAETVNLALKLAIALRKNESTAKTGSRVVPASDEHPPT
jgi:Arc/MetJ family transcription regulator